MMLIGRRMFNLPESDIDVANDIPFWHECETEGGAKPVRLCPCSSDVNLLGYGEGIIYLNTEIPDGALDLCMTQQQLHRPYFRFDGR
jgi:hypothetical protein